MASGTALLQQVLANPADDQARAVYADLLLHDGDPRGELITVDLELARTGRPELVARKAALLAEHGRRWWPAIPLTHLDVRRGFVERVAGTQRDFEAASAMFEHEPIDRVELYGMSQLAPGAWQRNLRGLVLRGSVYDRDLAQLAELPFAAQLETLDVTNLYALPHLGDAFPRVRSLALVELPNLASNLNKLLEWAHLGAVEQLDLRRSRLDPGALVELVPRLASVRDLRLSDNPIGRDGVSLLARHLAELPALQRLDLIDSGIGQDGARALAEALPGVQLTTEMPAEVVLDLVGRELRLVDRGNGAWSCLVDGVPMHAAVEIAERESCDEWESHRRGGDGMAVPLEPLARALAHGATRDLDDEGHADIEIVNEASYVAIAWRSYSVRIAISPAAVQFMFRDYTYTSI